MKIFVPTTATLARIHTDTVFDDQQPVNWVCHTPEQITRIAPAGQNDTVHASYAADYIGQLEYIQNQVQEGEWYLKADDNIRAFMDASGNTMSNKEAWRTIEQAVSEAEKRGARLVGFAPVDNPFFRKTKYRDVGFCVGKMYAEKRTKGIECSGEVRVMDDYERTAQHLFRFGRVLVCNSLHAKAKHYETGGIGSWDERLPRKKLDCQILVEKFLGLYRYKSKAGKDPKSEIQMRFTNLEQVQEWIMTMRLRSKQHAN